jgi:hypothetical protein
MANGERDSLRAVAQVAKDAYRSKLIRKWGGWVISAAALYVVGEIRGWEASLSRVTEVSALERRVEALEAFAADAGIEIGVLEVETRAAADFVRAAPGAALERDIEAHRDIVLTNLRGLPLSKVEAAIDRYEALIARGKSPHDAADIVLGWSRPPGR